MFDPTSRPTSGGAHWRRVSRIPTIVTTLHLSTPLPNTLTTKAAQPLACHLVSVLQNFISVSFATQNLGYQFVLPPFCLLSFKCKHRSTA